MTTPLPHDHHVHAISLTVRHLAASAPEQIAYLEALGMMDADELALEFHDDAQLAPSLLKGGAISPGRYDALCALDRKLHEMSGAHNAVLWTRLALEQSPHWEEVRALARRYLATTES